MTANEEGKVAKGSTTDQGSNIGKDDTARRRREQRQEAAPLEASRQGLDEDTITPERKAAMKKRADAIEAMRKADEEANLTDEQRKARKLMAEADDAEAKANEAEGEKQAEAEQPMTVLDAHVLAVVPPNTNAGDHYAQNFGNDPENPKLAKGIDVNKAEMVPLYRVTPDVLGPVVTQVPKEMVGDYERAGWNRSR